MISKSTLTLAALVLATGLPASAQVENRSDRVSTITARVERVDGGSRILTLRTPDGILHNVHVGPEVETFSTLNSGDTVVVSYVEEMVAKLSPSARPGPPQDTTADARAAAAAGDGASQTEILQQVTMTVTLDEVHVADRVVVYHGWDKVKKARAVQDPKLLEGFSPGDIVQVTVTRARAISVVPTSPQ